MQKEKELPEFFKIFAEPARIRILLALEPGEISVNDLASKLDMNQSSVSHQLRVLKDHRLVEVRRSGKQKFYRIFDEKIYPFLQQADWYCSRF